MFGQLSSRQPQKIGFLLQPDFSMIAFTASIEPLRSANRVRRETLYEWRTYSLDGKPVPASNKVLLTPDAPLREAQECSTIFVCAGLTPQRFLSPQLRNELRALALKGKAIGAVCTGSLALAYSGLLTNYRSTIHWEDIETYREIYPGLNITSNLYEIDRNRFTCSGGTAPLDMMIHSIKLDHGEALAMLVAEQMLHNFNRDGGVSQRSALEHRTPIHHPKIIETIRLMESHTESPISLETISKRVDLSVRQIERLFRDHLGTSPSRHYLSLRLGQARQYLRRTAMSVLEISVATGFNSASHFSRAYKAYYGHSPQKERALLTEKK